MKTGLWSFRILMVLVVIAIFADLLANEKPWYCKINGKSHFPVFNSWLSNFDWFGKRYDFHNRDWKNLDYETVIFPPVPYLPTTQDKYNRGCVSPFGKQKVPSMRWKHWLGTDRLGRDVLAGMIHGTRIALLVGLVSMFIATVIGIFFGAVSGYFGNNNFRPSRAGLISAILGCGLFLWFGIFGRAGHWAFAKMDGNLDNEILLRIILFIFTMLVFGFITILLKKNPYFRKSILLPLDSFVLRLIEVFKSLPGLLVILALVSLLEQPSVFYVMAIIGLLRWTGIAQYLRAELLKVREMEYIQAARVMGFSDWRIILRHALPNALTPVVITIAFGIASSILLEAFISFLGIGLAPEDVTWGSLLNDARQNFSAWWLALFPGLAIFITVSIFNLMGDALRNKH